MFHNKLKLALILVISIIPGLIFAQGIFSEVDGSSVPINHINLKKPGADF